MTRFVQIRLEDEEHRAFSELAEKDGGLQSVGKKLILAYMADKGLKSAGPFDAIKPREERILAGVLEILRGDSEESRTYAKFIEWVATKRGAPK